MKLIKLSAAMVALSMVTLCLQTPAHATAQQAGAATSAQSNDAKIKELMDAFYKARDEKDWGRCLEISEEIKAYGDTGYDLSKQMKFSVFMRSGDENHVKQLINDLLRNASNFTTDYSDFYKDDPKGLAMIDNVMKSLSNQLLGLKLAKLKALMSSGKPTDYVDYANSLMSGSDKDNSYLLNKIAWYIVSPDSNSPKELDGITKRNSKGEKMMAMGMGANAKATPFYTYDHFSHPESFKTQKMYQLAKTAIDRANELTQQKSGSYYDTLGWTYYRLGDKTKAYQAEMKAYELSKGDPFGNDLNYKQVAEWFKKS